MYFTKATFTYSYQIFTSSQKPKFIQVAQEKHIEHPQHGYLVYPDINPCNPFLINPWKIMRFVHIALLLLHISAEFPRNQKE